MSIHSPETAPPAVPATARQPKPRLIPRKVRQAIELIVTGVCKTKQAAADRVPRESLSRWLHKPSGAEALRSRAAHEVASSAGRAAARLTKLLDSSSQKVSLEAVKYSLGVAGIKPASEPMSVNVGVQVAGYVIDLRERDDRSPLPAVKIDGAGAVVVDDTPATKTIDEKPAGE
jgi:hypothetical protein